MSLNKSIQYGKEKRKSYTGEKTIFSSCRNHGKNYRWKNNRLYQRRKKDEEYKQKINDFHSTFSTIEYPE